eukprot:4337550-Prymnesium_polylepis.1
MSAFSGNQPDALPRYLDSDPPLSVLANERKLLKEGSFQQLLAAAPAAANVTSFDGSSIVHDLLRSRKATMAIIQAVLREAPSMLEPGIPGELHYSTTSWKVTSVNAGRRIATLQADPDRIGPKEPPLSDHHFDQLRFFDAPPAYPPPTPRVGMYVGVVRRPKRVTAVTMAVKSLVVDEKGDEKEVATAVKRALELLPFLLQRLPPEAFVMADQPGKPDGYNAAM